MPRFDRPDFDPGALAGLSAEQATRLKFDWWRDEGDREEWFEHLDGRIGWIDGRAPVQDDPAPPRSRPWPQGHARVAVLTAPADVERALTDTVAFSNRPYAELGGASFMLAIDPAPPTPVPDWHAWQRQVAIDALKPKPHTAPQLELAATKAVSQAAVLSLRADSFDLAEFAEQAALRYFGLLFGFADRDHLLLEAAARSGYRALQYLIVGRHFESEPATLPAAQGALAELVRRTSALMDEYGRLKRSPRLHRPPATTHPAAHWPDGVQPWSELGLSGLGEPVLRRLADLAGPPGQQLNGQDLCSLVGGLLVGTVGNVQTALCQMVEILLTEGGLHEVRKMSPAQLGGQMNRLLARRPPVPFLPRRTRQAVTLRGGAVPAETDCILVLRTPTGGPPCPHAWGGAVHKAAPHACVGRELIEPLLLALLGETVKLQGLDFTLDPLTGEPLEPVRLWGMGCLRFPLRHDRAKRLVQQPLIVVMRVKSPVAEHAKRLREVIRAGAPRIQWSLDDSRHVHMAWFEFMENDSLLALRTVYDGDFDAYIQHFALKVGDLFDSLFESIEGAPPAPVAEHPNEFVETIRRYNRAPLGGFFYSAYPNAGVTDIIRLAGATR